MICSNFQDFQRENTHIYEIERHGIMYDACVKFPVKYAAANFCFVFFPFVSMSETLILDNDLAIFLLVHHLNTDHYAFYRSVDIATFGRFVTS